MKPSAFSLTIIPLLALALLTTITPSLAQRDISWRDMTSVDEVCTTYPEKMKTMIGALNLDLPGLEPVRQSVADNDLTGACRALLNYYKSGVTAQFLRKEVPAITGNTTTMGDSIIQNIYVFQRVGDKVPILDNGHLNWNYTGPEDDIEWAWALNRHYPVHELLPIYFETGNADYARYIDLFIKDWIMQSWPYPAVKCSTAMWRGLEVSFRVKVWSHVFYGLMGTDYLSDATRLLILCSLPEHAHYARNFHAQNNWLTMEMSGLATVAVAWPEFKESGEWLEYAINTMVVSMKEQVYPDGTQTELTSSYHYVALNNFLQLQNICQAAGKQLPEFYTSTLEQMYNYLALTMRPDGNGLLNNDADLISNRDIILNAVIDHKRNDWAYIATNGKKGILPKDGPSYMFPWAGHLIFRSGFDENAHWSFFDIGPWGSGHQHNDKLHVSISAFGSDFLVDAGRFAYRGEVAEKFRTYARGSLGHNVLLFDGKGQANGPLLADEALSDSHYTINEIFDYAWGTFDKFNELEGNVEHSRTLLYVRGQFWVVVDRVITDKPRKVDALWHWHPDCLITSDFKGVSKATRSTGSLTVIPVGKTKWALNQVRGQEVPEIQGWYSKVYNQFEPNTTSIYTTNIKTDQTFTWLIVPSLPTASGKTARIIRENTHSIRLQVTDDKNGIWHIELPYRNNSKIKLEFKD